MNFLNLHYFLVCTEEMNFTRAAKRLFISQQSLSNHIKKLEDEYGVQLFTRGAHVTLTEAGMCLFRNAQQLLELQRKTENELLDIRDFRQGEIGIGIAPSRGTVMLPPVLSAYHKQFPQVRVRIVEGGNSEIREALLQGTVDAAIGFQVEDDAVKSELLFEEHQYFVVPDEIFHSHFSPARQAELLRVRSAPIGAFAGCPFVTSHSSTWTGKVLRAASEADGVELQVVAQAFNAQTTLALAKTGLGVCISSRTFLQDVLEDGGEQREKVHCFRLEGPLSATKIAICTKKDAYLTRAAREFVKLTREIYAEER